MDNYIKEYPSYKILGSIDTQSNGDQVARIYPSMQIVGYYRASSNQTTDAYGRILTIGNCLSALIYKVR